MSRGLEKLRERRDGEDAVGRPSERLDFLYQMLGIKNTKRICESQRVEDKTRVTTPWGTRYFPRGVGFDSFEPWKCCSIGLSHGSSAISILQLERLMPRRRNEIDLLGPHLLIALPTSSVTMISWECDTIGQEKLDYRVLSSSEHHPGGGVGSLSIEDVQAFRFSYELSLS